MIVIPKGKPIYKELSSSFVNLSKLIEEFGNSGISGLIELVGVHFEGEVLVENGNVVNLIIRGDVAHCGKAKLPDVIKLVQAENTLISAYLLPPESVIFLSCFLNSEKVFTNLPSEFTDVRKLISRFESEPGEYCIEILFNKNLGTGLLFIQDGHVMEALFSLLDRDVTTGHSAIEEIMDAADELGAVFNVYKGQLSAMDTTQPASGNSPTSFLPVDVICQLFFENFKKFIQIPRKGFDLDIFVRESALRLAEKYPFLDPFSGEFSFRNGQASIETNEAPTVVLDGLCELCSDIYHRALERKIAVDLAGFKSELVQSLSTESNGDEMHSLVVSRVKSIE